MEDAALSRYNVCPVNSALSACVSRSSPPLLALVPSLHPSSLPNLTVGLLIGNSVSQAVLSSRPNIHLLYVYLLYSFSADGNFNLIVSPFCRETVARVTDGLTSHGLV